MRRKTMRTVLAGLLISGAIVLNCTVSAFAATEVTLGVLGNPPEEGAEDPFPVALLKSCRRILVTSVVS